MTPVQKGAISLDAKTTDFEFGNLLRFWKLNTFFFAWFCFVCDMLESERSFFEELACGFMT